MTVFESKPVCSIHKQSIEQIKDGVAKWSCPKKGCKSKGFEVKIGPELLSDSLGEKEDQNTYTGMLLFNARTIAEYLR